MAFLPAIALLFAKVFSSVSACPDGFLPWHEGYCYSVSQGDANGWDYMVDNCRAAGGELSSIHSALENARITASMAASGVSGSVWTGLHCSGAPVWIDGTPVDHVRYGSGPCPYDNAKSYAFTISPGGSWDMETLSHSVKYRSLCRHRKRNGERCSDYDEIEDRGICYGIRTDPKSWSLAENLCLQEGGHLLSIHDQAANRYLSKLIQDAERMGNTSGAYHIGMQTTASGKGETMTWTDSSKVNYTNYDTGYPTDLLGHCTAMQSGAYGGKWITTQCEQSDLPYICGRPVNNPIQASGCPANPNFKDSGTIMSPSYPGGSGTLSSCEYFLTVQAGMKVNLAINDLNMNLCCDKLMLYDGLAATTPFATLSGKATQASYTTPTSNVLKMVYSSTDGTFVRGWKVTFKGV